MDGFAARLRRAFRAWEDRLGRDVTQTELGELVGRQTEDRQPITQQSVARWFAGTLPDHARMIALATVLGADPGWLAYGPDDDSGEGNVTVESTPKPTPSSGSVPVRSTDMWRSKGPPKAKPKRRPKEA